MSGPAMLMHMLLERLSLREQARVPEPDLVMEDPAQIAAFLACGREDGLLAPVYFFHAVQSSLAIRPGDQVLDLACGPGNQLVQLARLNPEARFVGVDMSANMLELAEGTLERCGVGNVRLQQGDITKLSGFGDASVDCVTCTLSLHHLPDTAALRQTMLEVRRVLRPGGGIYLADFGRLKRAATQHYFSHDRAGCQTPQFTADYLNSLKAAFSTLELSEAIAPLGAGVERHQTILAPFTLIFRRARQAAPRIETQRLAQTFFRSMSPGQRQDFRAFSNWFRAAGLGLPFSLSRAAR